MANESNKVWFITGCSSGFGKEQAALVLKQGYRAVVTARSVDKVQHFADEYPDRALALSLDVTQEDDIQAAVEQTLERFGRIDVLFNNAGYGAFGSLEAYSVDEVQRQFTTNVFGLLRLTQAVLPTMRAQQSGHILNMASVAGKIAPPGFGLYAGSKHAVEGFSKSLAAEVAPFNIKVTVIEPGIFRTDFGGRSLGKTKHPVDAYQEMMQQTEEQVVRQYENYDEQQGDPAKAVQAMLKITEVDHPPLFLALGADAVEGIHQQLQREQQDLDQWKELSQATIYASDKDILNDF